MRRSAGRLAFAMRCSAAPGDIQRRRKCALLPKSCRRARVGFYSRTDAQKTHSVVRSLQCQCLGATPRQMLGLLSKLGGDPAGGPGSPMLYVRRPPALLAQERRAPGRVGTHLSQLFGARQIAAAHAAIDCFHSRDPQPKSPRKGSPLGQARFASLSLQPTRRRSPPASRDERSGR